MDAFDNLIDEPIEPMKQFSEYLRTTYGVDDARVMTQSAAKAWEEILRAGGDISRSHAAEIQCPCLLIVGENDFLCPPALASEMASAIPKGEFAQVPNAAHSLHHEAPDALVSLIAAWLGRTS
jgi:pimeloyl-ACP methyl ester carboxylesterase